MKTEYEKAREALWRRWDREWRNLLYGASVADPYPLPKIVWDTPVSGRVVET